MFVVFSWFRFHLAVKLKAHLGGLGLRVLKQGLDSQPEVGLWVTTVKAPNLAAGPVVRDKGPGPLGLEKGIVTKTESGETRTGAQAEAT